MIGRRPKPSTTEVYKFEGFNPHLGDLMRDKRATIGKSLLDVQRELKIKATYIAAIESADVSAFETQGFVAGYVRSYARYLGMDPDWVFQKFCTEANFNVAHGISVTSSSTMTTKRAVVDYGDPLANPNAIFIPRSENVFLRTELSAMGAVVILTVLIGSIGYGGWSVLQEVQRVQLSPFDQAPSMVAEIDPLFSANPVKHIVTENDIDVPLNGKQTVATAHLSLDRLYRPEALDVPVLTLRDGPIASIDPRQTGTMGQVQSFDILESAVDQTLGQVMDTSVRVVAEAAPSLEVFAVRPSWVRVQSADGTVLFEKILDAGERYLVPRLEAAPLLRAGNSEAIYFVVNGKTYGPAATDVSVVKNLALSADSLIQAYAEADISADSDLAKFVNVAEVTLGTTPSAN